MKAGCSYLLEAELVGELLSDALVALVVQLTAVDVGVLGLDAEDVLCIFFIGDADVHVLAEVGHSGSCLLSRPQLAAVVQVTGDLDTALLGGLAGFLADLYEVFTESRCDTGKVEPIGPPQR